MPEPLGNIAHTTWFVDANHAGNIVTQSLHAGVFIYVMNEPIIWFSKNLSTVEISTFGSEFVEMRVARDIIVALCKKIKNVWYAVGWTVIFYVW